MIEILLEKLRWWFYRNVDPIVIVLYAIAAVCASILIIGQLL